MRRMKGAAGLLTALLLAFQLSAQTFALANEDNGIKVVPVNFTHNGYSYEIEGVAKSTEGILSPCLRRTGSYQKGA